MTVPKLYPKSVYAHPPSDFDNVTEELAVKVKNAVAGFGTDEDTLIRELGDEPADHRLKLYYCYKEKFGDDLDKVMQKEMGKGNVGKCLQVRATRHRFSLFLEYIGYTFWRSILFVWLFVSLDCPDGICRFFGTPLSFIHASSPFFVIL
jgi:Annexin